MNDLLRRGIRRFVEKSGGPAKVREARRRIGNIPDEQRAEYVRRVAAQDAGARQLLSAAMLGFIVADELQREEEYEHMMDDAYNDAMGWGEPG